MARPLGRRPTASLKFLWAVVLIGVFSVGASSTSSAQTRSTALQDSQPAAPESTQKPDAKPAKDEIVTHDAPVTFKVRVNIVLVRVVVRDANGKAVPNLKKEDFQLADNRKLQTISSFSIETPGSQVSTGKIDSPESPDEAPAKAPELPQRFITLFFDDLYLSTQDILSSRQAAIKLFATLGPGDRIAIFTTSGEANQDFTADRAKLNDTLLRVVPHPLLQNSDLDCPPMTVYEAYSLANNPFAMQLATQEATGCAGDPRMAASMAQQAAARKVIANEAQLQVSFSSLIALIRRMNALPGQRVIAMMSPGFFVSPARFEVGDILDRAIKANIAINTIDARGLYVSPAYDPSSLTISTSVTPLKVEMAASEQLAQEAVLAEYADGTGGVFFHNRNDIDQGLLQAAAEPEVSYVLGFAPQNLKLDGSYHNLKVTLLTKEKWTLQARRGYFAPQGEIDPQAAAKEEIRQAIFSQEEMRELPIDSQTQFFKTGGGVRLSVVTHVDTSGLKFRKVEDRNNDDLTISTAIFDQNGNLLTGQEKILELSLKDGTRERVSRTGLNVKASFDLQPGSFLVRVVARDSEGAQMGAVIRGVAIP
jgi:VWFA-related protein